MKKRYHLSFNEFIRDLKKLVKPHYFASMWPIAGIMIIFLVLSFIIGYFAQGILSSMGIAMMMVMYGMVSAGALLMGVLELVIAIALFFALSFFYSFFTISSSYTYQDKIRNPEQIVSAGSLWMHYKHVRKNQLWRILLYMALFVILWTIPLSIVSSVFASNKIVVLVCRILNDLIIIWKELEYSQAFFLYRDRQPQFLGQSMRYALTASRRFMGGRKLNYLLVVILTVVLPIVVWIAIFGGLAYWGIYTATAAFMYIGFALIILGYAFYLPVIFAVTPLYYEKAKETANLDEDFAGVFKPVAELTGEAYVHEVYTPKKKAKKTKAKKQNKKKSEEKSKEDK